MNKEIEGKIWTIEEIGAMPESIIYWGMNPDAPDELTSVSDLLKMRHVSCIIAAYPITDWNAQLSPWAASGVFSGSGNHFAGMGKDTLVWLKSCKNTFQNRYQTGKPLKHFLCGYSLCGLFSLWGFTQDQEFWDGAASCSGSLWYPNWMKYLHSVCMVSDNNANDTQKLVYISLGKKEEKSRNPVMSTVGDNTRATFELIQNVPCLKSTLVWHDGGHFNHPEERISHAIKWLADNIHEIS